MSVGGLTLQHCKTVLYRPSTRLLITALLVGIIVYRLDQQKIWLHIMEFNPWVGCAMLIINMLLISLFTQRWRLIAAKLDIRLPFRQMLKAVWLAAFLGQFGPTLVISEWTRFHSLRNTAKTGQIVASQILDRLSGQIVLFTMVLLLSPFYYSIGKSLNLFRIEPILSIVLVMVLIGFFALRRYTNIVPEQYTRVIRILHPLKSTGHYAHSLLIQLLLILNFVLAAASLNALEHIFPFILLVPLVLSGITLLPFAIADWGTREATALLIFSIADLSPETIISISIVYGLVNLLSTLPGGLYLIHSHRSA